VFKNEQSRHTFKTYHHIATDGNPTVIVDYIYFIYKN